MMRVAKKVVVTLHEYSSMPIPQRASTHMFRWTADQLLFTSDAELQAYGQSNVTQRVVHIGSNVPAFPWKMPRTSTVLYFGQIRPNKGLEEFLELARRSMQLRKPLKYRVIGSVPPRREAYYEAIRSTAAPEVEWLIDLPVDLIAQLMASSLAAYLPYPDGASYRRGSLIAALTNGLPTITKIGPATPRDMIDVLLPATGLGDAFAHLERLYNCPGETHSLGSAGRLFAKKFNWTEIARQHEQVYLEALSPATVSRERAVS
jgi:glycosyltransferase involved in cell wall biosynthesis